jgi:hypothetical protein
VGQENRRALSIAPELARRGVAPARFPARDRLVVRAVSIRNVTTAEAAVEQLLQQRGLERGCDGQGPRSFCPRLPERNNFRSALTERYKVAGGGAFFTGLLLMLLAIGAAGLQVQTVVSRWRDYGILQAVGFTPGQGLVHAGLQLALVLAIGRRIAPVGDDILRH